MTRIRTSPTMRQKNPLCPLRHAFESVKLQKKRKTTVGPLRPSPSKPEFPPAKPKISRARPRFFLISSHVAPQRWEKIVMLLSKRGCTIYQGECGFRNDTCTRVWSRLLAGTAVGHVTATRYSVRDDLRLKHSRSTIESFPWHLMRACHKPRSARSSERLSAI